MCERATVTFVPRTRSKEKNFLKIIVKYILDFLTHILS